MSSLDVLHYAMAFSIIVIGGAVIVITVFIILILQDIRKLLHTLQKTAEKIRYWKDEVQSDVIGGVLSLGKSIFKKKSDE